MTFSNPTTHPTEVWKIPYFYFLKASLKHYCKGINITFKFPFGLESYDLLISLNSLYCNKVGCHVHIISQSMIRIMYALCKPAQITI